jgi:hypothetical protein
VNGLTERHRFEWNGVLLEITYEPQWLPPAILGEDLAHMEVRSAYFSDDLKQKHQINCSTFKVYIFFICATVFCKDSISCC